MNQMYKKFPKDFHIFPLTFCLPSDSNLIYEYIKNKTKFTLIVKPEAAA